MKSSRDATGLHSAIDSLLPIWTNTLRLPHCCAFVNMIWLPCDCACTPDGPAVLLATPTLANPSPRLNGATAGLLDVYWFWFQEARRLLFDYESPLRISRRGSFAFASPMLRSYQPIRWKARQAYSEAFARRSSHKFDPESFTFERRAHTLKLFIVSGRACDLLSIAPFQSSGYIGSCSHSHEGAPIVSRVQIEV